MIKMTENMVVADNEVILNGVRFMVNDDLAEKIYSMIKGDANMRAASVSAPQTVYTTSTSTKPETKTPYVATKDFKPQFEVKEQTATDGTKLFCISRKNGWTKAEKSLMNGSIKALKGIKEIEVSYEKDGKTRTFKAWGYATKATADKHLKELPTVFTVAQLNGEA